MSYLPGGLELLAEAIEAISAPRNRCAFVFPARISLTDPNGRPYGELAWDVGAHTYRFYPNVERVISE